MALRVYVNEEGVKKVKGAQGFYKTGRDGCEQWHIPGIITLAYEKGCCFLTLNEVSDPIPSAIAEFVGEVTVREYHQASKRESGIYRYKTAEAEVIMDSSGKSVSIFIRGKSREDALDLLEKIKTGTIRPEKSYEAPQDGMSSEEIRAKLADIKFCEAKLDSAGKKIKKIEDLAMKIINHSKKTWLPFPRWIVDELVETLG